MIEFHVVVHPIVFYANGDCGRWRVLYIKTTTIRVIYDFCFFKGYMLYNVVFAC